MPSTAATPEAYLSELPDDRKNALNELRAVLLRHLPHGFKEEMSYGMLGYVVPHELYPPGYHCNPKLPLPFISIAAQKNFIALYHMGLYMHPELLHWFQEEYQRQGTVKLDMGKSCIRFKKPEHIPYKLIGELAAKLSPQQWITVYESKLKR
ncbi:DUF1801 domain-containing protein [Paraflavisolibacter sp. H34]|uniref:DUF1801 domain-containing protein n=1 Tax=Huijunlia imazamoxiresistens TaxID=3127457 RepID=UPI0030181779